MTGLVQHAVDAVSFGSLYALAALGIALIFGVMRLINFAHGELIMVGSFTAALLTGSPWPVLLVAPLAVSVVFAVLMDRVAFRPVRGAGPPTLLITSFALSYLLQNLATLVLGSQPRTGVISTRLDGVLELGHVAVPWIQVVTVATTLVALSALALLLRRTSIGLEMRAAAEDFRTAQLLGVRADTVIAVAFACSGALAGLAAVLLVAQIGIVTSTIGTAPLLVAFVATILGGLGSLTGAVVGAYLVGAATVALQTYLPAELKSFRDAFVYAAIVLVLLARPQGLMRSNAYLSRA